jgi:hypothetical protein
MSSHGMTLFFQFSYNPSTPIPTLMIGENLLNQLLLLPLFNRQFIAVSPLVTVVSRPAQA